MNLLPDPAGDSGASRPADRLRRRLERRTAQDQLSAGAVRYNERLERGIAGEEIVGPELEHRLSGTGVMVEHSLQFLVRGDIDN